MRAALAVILLTGCTEMSQLPPSADKGPDPTLPAPERRLIPTVHTATAKGWAAGETPKPAPGMRVNAFASGLDHPRWIYVLPNGDVLVAETNAPVRPKEGKGFKAFFMN